MGAVAGIASAVLDSTAKSGQQGTSSPTNASQSSAITNAQNSKPYIKSAKVKSVTETPVPKTESSGSSMNWAELAKAAKGLLDEHTSHGSPAPVTVNTTSQASPLANFR